MSPKSSNEPGGLPESLRAEVQHHWEEFAARDALLDRQQEILHVWAASPLAAKTCVQNPQLLSELVSSGDLARAYTLDEMFGRVAGAVENADSESALMRAMRVLRRREWLRIAWRDLNGAADLDETLRELSAMAEGFVEQALKSCYNRACERYGVPRNANGAAQQLVVLGMGKLGGAELNFSSDIDLIFAYPEDGQTDGRRAQDNREFFTRMGQKFIKVLSEYTADGFVFRIDMRLRPFGDGPLAISFDAMEHYYQTHGREWERYAMVKARVIAGDRAAGDELLRRLRPFVYRRYLDYGAFGSLRDMKALIDGEVSRRELIDNIKLGAGGIREIEFISQAFQLVRGGRDAELQQRELRAVLPCLARKGQLAQADVDALLAAYTFLRRVENRLQMVGDQQTHALPEQDSERARLAFAMNFHDWASFAKALDEHRRAVHERFEHTFGEPGAADPETDNTGSHRALVELSQGRMDDDRALALLRKAGFDDPATVLPAIKALYTGHAYQAQGETSRVRLNRLMPLLLAEVASQPEAARTLSRILPLIEAIARRSVYLALLAEHREALAQLVKLSGASKWIAEYLSNHPILLDELLNPRDLYAPPDRDGLAAQLGDEFARIDPFDMEAQMERLRQFKQVNVLRVAAADVMEALPLMRISDQLTWIAEVILEHVLKIAWQQMTARYGKPGCVIDGERYTPGFAIIAYGKLGGIELGYGSDLDLVYLHDSAGKQQCTDGGKSIDNATFFGRLAQRIVHALTAFTPAGQLYEVDMRLRPSGAAGILVSGVQAFELYQRDRAWTWEHQALARARPVAGSADISARFQRMRAGTLVCARDTAKLRHEVKEMRERMWRELGSRDATRFDLKKDPGGIADIEFMVQYHVLAHTHDHGALSEFTDNIRILDALVASDLLPVKDARFLQDVYRAYRDRVHALSLQGDAAVVDSHEFSEQRAGVQRLWRELMEVS